MSDYKTFTSQDLIKVMGLSVGDKVKVTFKDDTIEEYEIIKNDNGNIILHDDFYGYDAPIGYLLDHEIEILPKPKRVGDLKCSEFDSCITCPLQWLCFRKIDEKNEMETTLYEMLENFVVTDQEIYDFLKKRLDKEVKEHESNTN